MASQEQRHAEVAVHCLRVGEICMQQRNYGRAFAHYLLVLKLQPWQKPEIKDNFTLALKEWAEQLEHAGRMQDLFTCYEQACQLFPECEAMLNNMGAQLFRLGYADEAAGCFRKALRLCPDFMAARHNLDNLRGHLVDRWHFSMLNDQRRNQAYQQAVEDAIERGYDVVLDIGSGTGLLSMFAAQAGANCVYGCEMSKTMHDLSCDIVRANQMEGDLQLIHKKSTNLTIPADLPARVSLVVTETFDAGLFGEHILSTLSHAWKHLLNTPEPNKALVIPGGASVYVTALESKSIRIQNKFLYPGLRYLDLGDVQLLCKTSASPASEDRFLSFQSHSLGDASDDPSTCDSSSESPAEEYEPYTCERLTKLPGGYQLLTDTRVATDINFNDPEMIDSYLQGFQRELTLRVTHSGRLDALAVWFDLHLDDDLTLTSDPKADSCWQQAVFPVHIEGQQYVRCGDELTVQCRCQQDRLQMTCTAITRKRHRTNSETQPSTPSNVCPQRSPTDHPASSNHQFSTSSCNGAPTPTLSSFDGLPSNIQFGDTDFFGMQDPLRYRGVSFLSSNDVISSPMQPHVVQPLYASQSTNAVYAPEPAYQIPGPMQDLTLSSSSRNLPQSNQQMTQNSADYADADASSRSAYEVDLPDDASLRRDRLLSEVILMPDTMSVEPSSNGHSAAASISHTDEILLPSLNSSSSSNGQIHSSTTIIATSDLSVDAMQLANFESSFFEQDQTDSELRDPFDSELGSATNLAFTDEACDPDLDPDPPRQKCIDHLPNSDHLINGMQVHSEDEQVLSELMQPKTTPQTATQNGKRSSLREEPTLSDNADPADQSFECDPEGIVGASNVTGSPKILTSPQGSCIFHLERQELERLNDLEWGDAYCSALQALKAKTIGDFTVLDLTQGATLLPLQAITIGASQVGVAHAETSKEQMLREVARTNGLAEDSLQFELNNVEQGQREWSVVLTELVEPCGTFCQQVLENLALSRVTCLKPGGMLMPSAARVYGLLIESPCLNRDSSVVCDETTLGLHVADYINEFQMMTHVDIDLSSLKYKRLSDPFEMFSLDFNEPSDGEIPSFLEQTSQQRITACDFGQVTAVVYWFELDLTENVRLCTLEPTRHWRQAAVMQRCHLDVSTGTELLITAACKNSYVDVTVKAY